MKIYTWPYLIIVFMSVANAAINFAQDGTLAKVTGVIWALGAVVWYFSYRNACKLKTSINGK